MGNCQQLLSLLHLSSPALPVGGFAYSQGLESAIELGWVKDRATMVDWLSGILSQGMSNLELPVMRRMVFALAGEDSRSIQYWNQFLFACRESHELQFEDQQVGEALRRLLLSLEITGVDRLPKPASYALMFCSAVQHWDIDIEAALSGFCWSWLENQVAVACKTIPLGQTDGQKIMMSMKKQIEVAIERSAVLEDDQLGVSLPGLAIASALHETQYSRLFRS
ncbi:urease accessory protein F [Oleiphilus messinensis]|uniref:Urease accessory protein UreF n=2 Tax=Oleiphilus messinensis TaxID=141451 RepID=A0A1Y0I2R5_9GAMM|nr:urease accessory protein F [Oleiphilus messinensis]